MDRKAYNQCVAQALKGKHLTPPERRLAFCVAAKECTGKAKSHDEAVQMCELSASQPKEHKVRRARSPGAAPASPSSVFLSLLTTTGCKPCQDAKAYLKDKIDSGLVRVGDVQKDDWAADLVAKNRLSSVPKLLVIDSEGNVFSEIQITDSAQTI